VAKGTGRNGYTPAAPGFALARIAAHFCANTSCLSFEFFFKIQLGYFSYGSKIDNHRFTIGDIQLDESVFGFGFLPLLILRFQ